jgi:hypothetical protein
VDNQFKTVDNQVKGVENLRNPREAKNIF